jgi:hypothetical protein
MAEIFRFQCAEFCKQFGLTLIQSHAELREGTRSRGRVHWAARWAMVRALAPKRVYSDDVTNDKANESPGFVGFS